jgi:uncharacterized protein (TIGR02271 family)
MADARDSGLVSLDHDEWAVADGEPDVRGWDVVTSDQRKIGEVDDLLADPSAMKVRFLEIELDAEAAIGGNRDRTVRVPISRARIHEADRKVVLDLGAVDLQSIASAPSQPWRDDQIKLTRSAEELRIGKRQAKAGEVEVKKRVETERVRENVTLRSEDVDVQRRSVTGTTPRDVQITAEEIRVPLYEEEAVVEKRPVVKEEVVISKHPIEKTETVEADVRTERIDVERHDDVRGREPKNRDRSR